MPARRCGPRTPENLCPRPQLGRHYRNPNFRVWEIWRDRGLQGHHRQSLWKIEGLHIHPFQAQG